MTESDRAEALDYFCGSDDIAAARALAADASPARRAGAACRLAWALRQRDTREALAQADRAEALGCADAGRLALVRAEAAWLFHDLDAAHGHLARAVDAFADQGDPLGLGDAALMRTSLHDQAGADRQAPLADAERHYRIASAGDRLLLLRTWRACADPERADIDFDAPEILAKPGLRAFVEGARGLLAWRRGDPAAAIDAFQRGYDAAIVSGQLQSAATLAANAGIAFSTLNDHEAAMQWAECARAVVAPTGWTYQIGWCLMQTGAILVGLGRAGEARRMLEEGMPIFERVQGSRNHVLACQSLGEACLALAEDEAALHWCERALAAARAAPFPDLESGLLRHQALALSRLGRPEAAVSSAERALALAQAQGDEQRVPTIHHVLAEISRHHRLAPPRGSHAASGTRHHLERALAQGRGLAGFQPPAAWLQELSAAQEAEGDMAGALSSARDALLALRAEQQRRADDLATAMLVRHRTAQAESGKLRAELLVTQAALDKERLQTLLVHAGKMAAIGRLVAGIVHEMSHPVGTVLLLAESLREAWPDAPARLHDGLGTVVGETRRLQQLVARLRHVARADPLQVGTHDLLAMLADARQLYGPRLNAEAVSVIEAVPAARVQADPQRLTLALANLMFNAADALAGRASRQVWLHGEAAGAQYLLHVDDDGPGLPAEVRAQLFQPFVTTRPEGLGLGLTLSHEAVSAMGGELSAGERPGGGARFTITLVLQP